MQIDCLLHIIHQFLPVRVLRTIARRFQRRQTSPMLCKLMLPQILVAVIAFPVGTHVIEEGRLIIVLEDLCGVRVFACSITSGRERAVTVVWPQAVDRPAVGWPASWGVVPELC